MALNMDKLRERRAAEAAEKASRGAGKRTPRWKPPEGVSVVALAPPTEAMDGWPFVEHLTHNDVGPAKGFHGCLSFDNPLLNHPAFLAALEARNAKAAEKGWEVIELDGHCPTCAEVAGETEITGFSPERLDKMAARPSHACGVMYWGRLNGATLDPVAEADKFWQQWLASPSVTAKMEATIEVDGDVTDPAGMVLLQITRTGKEAATRYDARSYSPTIKTPIVLSKPLKAALRKAQEDGGDLDLYRSLAWGMKPAGAVEAMLHGTEVSHTSAPAETEGKPQCFGTDCDPNEAEWCQRCPFKVECAGKCKKPVPGPNDGVFPFDGKTWADRDMADPALAAPAEEAPPPVRPAGRPAGKPATPPPAAPAAPVARPAPAVAPQATRTAAPVQRPAAAPAAAPAARPAAVARPAAAPAPAARPAAAVARPATAPLTRPTAAPVARPAAAPAARPVARPAPAPVADPDPVEEEDLADVIAEDEAIDVGPGEERTEPVEGEMDGDDELDSFEAELRGS